MTTAKEIVDLAQSWIGKKESDGSHRSIIDLYNTQRPLPRGYAVKYTDDWCAATVSALAVQLKCTDTIPTECSCPKMAAKFRSMGRWKEKGYVPNPGDVIFYDWKANHGDEDHVGIVKSVINGVITTIEGNYHNSVDTRVISKDYQYIRGFGLPKYEPEVSGKWVQDRRGWRYLENGKPKTNCWIQDSKDWCYLDSRGYMLTNAWVEDSQGWCFVKDDGRILRNGYASDSKGQHYLDKSGHIGKEPA